MNETNETDVAKTRTVIDPTGLTSEEIWEAMVDTLGIPVSDEDRERNAPKRPKT